MTLAGAVYRPGAYALRPGLTLRQLLQEAQGLTPEAYADWALLRRLDPATGAYQALALSPARALQGAAGFDLSLQARDLVTIYTRQEIVGDLTVLVTGQVRTPGAVPFVPGLTLRDAILQAGGLLPEAFTDQVQIVRVQPDMRRSVLSTSLKLALAGDPGANLPLQAHDSVNVRAVSEMGAASRVTIQGQVKRPGEYPRYEGMKVSDLIAAAGGLVPGAAAEAQITRGRYTAAPQTVSLTLDPAQALSPVHPDAVLQDDDLVSVMALGGFVARPASVLVMGRVAAPGPYVLAQPLSNPEGVWDLLARAGGLRPEAYGPGIVVYRPSETLLTAAQQAEFQRLIQVLDSQKRDLRTGDYSVPLSPAPGTTVPAPLPSLELNPLTPAATADLETAASAEAAPASATPPPPTLALGTEAGPLAAEAPAPAVLQKTTQVLTRGLAQAFGDNRGNVLLIAPPRDLAEATFSRVLALDWPQVEKTRGQRGDVVLRDGDVIYVPARPGEVLVAGAVQNQGAQRFEPGMSVRDAITRAGGFGPDSDPSRILILRCNGQVTPIVRQSEKLQPGDAVLVPTTYMVKALHSQTGLERIMSFLAATVAGFRFLF